MRWSERATTFFKERTKHWYTGGSTDTATPLRSIHRTIPRWPPTTTAHVAGGSFIDEQYLHVHLGGAGWYRKTRIGRPPSSRWDSHNTVKNQEGTLSNTPFPTTTESSLHLLQDTSRISRPPHAGRPQTPQPGAFPNPNHRHHHPYDDEGWKVFR